MEYSSDLKVDSASTVTRNVYDKLFNAIVTGYFKPGERLLERQLSAEMGISRTPIREAFRELQRQKLVKALPYKGVEVVQLTKKEALDIMEVCILLEEFITELVVQNSKGKKLDDIEDNLYEYKKALDNKDYPRMKELNYEFHNLLAKHSDNDYVIDMYNNVRAIMSLISEMTIEGFMRDEETYYEHLEIYKAIKEGNIERAKAETVNHIVKTKQFLMSKY